MLLSMAIHEYFVINVPIHIANYLLTLLKSNSYSDTYSIATQYRRWSTYNYYNGEFLWVWLIV